MAKNAKISTGRSRSSLKAPRKRANASVKIIESAPIQRSSKERDPDALKKLLSGLTGPEHAK